MTPRQEADTLIRQVKTGKSLSGPALLRFWATYGRLPATQQARVDEALNEAEKAAAKS